MSLKNRTTALGNWSGEVPWTWDGRQLAALAAILDELRKLNNVMQCPNTARIPRYLKRIASNTAKPKKKARRVDNSNQTKER